MARFDLSDGGHLYYEVHGAGEPIVILNGIMMNAVSWAEHVPMLAPRAQVVLVDFRDQGRSSRLEAPYDLETHARDLGELLDGLGLEGAHLLGLSYGGQVALRFVAGGGATKLRSLILANVVRRIGPHLRAIGRAWETAAALDDGERFFELAIPYIYSASFYERANDYLEDRLELFKRILDRPWFEAMIRLSRATEGYEVSDAELAAVDVPTLLIGADADIIAPVRDMDELYRLIPGAEMLVLRDAGHAAFLERKGELVTALLGFVAKHGAPAKREP